jgi:hypothetical protein
MYKQKIIFLDIDGVLNNHTAKNIYDKNSILPQCIESLNNILISTFAQIIIISNWSQQLTLSQLQKMLSERGLLTNSIVGAIEPTEITQNGLTYSTIEKDKFIKKYIEENQLDSYLIIDDNLNSELLDNSRVIKPSTHVGLNQEHVKTAVKILLRNE